MDIERIAEAFYHQTWPVFCLDRFTRTGDLEERQGRFIAQKDQCCGPLGSLLHRSDREGIEKGVRELRKLDFKFSVHLVVMGPDRSLDTVRPSQSALGPVRFVS
jgi:hypothetical protein